jgi:hypothetical protein
VGSRGLTLERYWIDTLCPLFVDANDRLADGTRAAKKMIFRHYVLQDPLTRLPLDRVTEEDIRRLQARLRHAESTRRKSLAGVYQ